MKQITLYRYTFLIHHQVCDGPVADSYASYTQSPWTSLTEEDLRSSGKVFGFTTVDQINWNSCEIVKTEKKQVSNGSPMDNMKTKSFPEDGYEFIDPHDKDAAKKDADIESDYKHIWGLD